MSQLTNFEKVQEFNRAFDMVPKMPAKYISLFEDELGRIQCDPFGNIRPKLFTDEPKTIKLRLDLIKEEIGELDAAFKENNTIEVRDALADILYVVYGYADVLGIEINRCFKDYVYGFNQKKNITSAFELLSLIHKYSNENDMTKPIGLTNFAFVRVYGELIKDDPQTPKDILVLIKTAYDSIADISQHFDKDTPTLEYFTNLATQISIILYWVYSMANKLGINADADFAIVHNSNMSKLCDNEDDARATVADYEAKFAKGDSPYDSPYYYYLGDIDKYIVKNRSSGKALKNIKYKKVDFTAKD